MSDDDKRVGQNIKRLRESAGMSQADLAEALDKAGVPGMHPQTITKLELGQRVLKFSEALAIAKLLAGSEAMAHMLADDEPRHLTPGAVMRPLLRTRKAAIDAMLAYMQERAEVAVEIGWQPDRVTGMDLVLARMLLSPDGDPEELIDDARELWAQTPLSAWDTFEDEENADLERSMKRYVEGQERLPAETWALLAERAGSADGEHQEAP